MLSCLFARNVILLHNVGWLGLCVCLTTLHKWCVYCTLLYCVVFNHFQQLCTGAVPAKIDCIIYRIKTSTNLLVSHESQEGKFGIWLYTLCAVYTIPHNYSCETIISRTSIVDILLSACMWSTSRCKRTHNSIA